MAPLLSIFDYSLHLVSAFFFFFFLKCLIWILGYVNLYSVLKAVDFFCFVLFFIFISNFPAHKHITKTDQFRECSNWESIQPSSNNGHADAHNRSYWLGARVRVLVYLKMFVDLLWFFLYLYCSNYMLAQFLVLPQLKGICFLAQ